MKRKRWRGRYRWGAKRTCVLRLFGFTCRSRFLTHGRPRLTLITTTAQLSGPHRKCTVRQFYRGGGTERWQSIGKITFISGKSGLGGTKRGKGHHLLVRVLYFLRKRGILLLLRAVTATSTPTTPTTIGFIFTVVYPVTNGIRRG